MQFVLWGVSSAGVGLLASFVPGMDIDILEPARKQKIENRLNQLKERADSIASATIPSPLSLIFQASRLGEEVKGGVKPHR